MKIDNYTEDASEGASDHLAVPKTPGTNTEENIYCDMQSFLPPSLRVCNEVDNVEYLKAGNEILEELLKEEYQSDYVLPTQYEPFDIIMNLIRKGQFRQMTQELEKLSSSTLVDYTTQNNLLHQCVLENITNGVSVLAALNQYLLLEKNSDELTPALLAIKVDHVSCLKPMVEYLIEDRDHYTSLIFLAVEREQLQCLEVLLKADSNLRTDSYRGITNITPVHSAAKYGYVGCLQLLLEYGLDVCYVNEDGKTALELARDNNHLECYNYLIMVEICHQFLDRYFTCLQDSSRTVDDIDVLESSMFELTMCLNETDTTCETKRRLNDLDIMRQELNSILEENQQEESLGTKCRSKGCMKRLINVVEQLRHQAIIVQKTWSRDDKLRTIIDNVMTRELRRSSNFVENRSHILRDLIKCIKSKMKDENIDDVFNNFLKNHFKDNTKTSKSHKTDTVHQGTQIAHRDVTGNTHNPLYENSSISSSCPLIYDIFPDSVSNTSDDTASTLTQIYSQSTVSRTSFNTDSMSESLGTSCSLMNYEEFSYNSDSELGRTNIKKLNVINEDLPHEHLREERLAKHLEAIQKLSSDQGEFIETVVTANGQRLESITGRNRSTGHINLSINHPFACSDLSKTANSRSGSKSRIKWPLKLFRVNSAPTKKISKSSFREGYERKPQMKRSKTIEIKE
ncbi:uncharacterized protein LOC126814926 isoform X2 [Patella vulgata]|nr:uncharacterized protein LOC126814926 isoform X2 [Patella vulgata]